MSEEVVVEVDMAKYKHVDLPLERAIEFLERLAELRDSPDIAESLRYLRNFDEFYEYMRKKFKDYIAPPHRPEDYIRGRATVDKLKLYVGDNGEKRVTIILDRRVKLEDVKRVLEGMGLRVIVNKAF